MTHPGAITEKFRKIVECVFWGRNKEVIVYDMDTGLASEGGKWAETLKKPKSKTLPALVIRDSATTFEDMLRKLKTNVTGNVTKDIKTIKKTRAGDLLLEMDNEDNLQVLKEELKKHVGEAEVKSLRGNSAAVHVYDVDAVTTAEELVAVVESVTGPGTITVTSMRPMAGSRQAATLESSGENVEKLLRQQNIRIGWSSCRIKKKIPINRCFNCGSISHMAKGCKEKPMGDKCRRCGGDGHKGADCREATEYCWTCKKEGHRNASFKCPAFKEAIQKGARSGGATSVAGAAYASQN